MEENSILQFGEIKVFHSVSRKGGGGIIFVRDMYYVHSNSYFEEH